MSTAKLIFTYKRKRLSSCSGVESADVGPDFSLDIDAGKHHADIKEELESPVEDRMIFRQGADHIDMGCSTDDKSSLESSYQQVESSRQHCCQGKEFSNNSSPQLHGSIGVTERYQAHGSNTSSSMEVQLGSLESSEDINCKASGENVSSEATLQDTTELTNKSQCVNLESSFSLNDGCIHSGLVSQSMEQSSLLKQRDINSLENSKCKSTTPLLTFSRRLKRKADAGTSVISGELPTKEVALEVRASEAISVPSSSCEVTSSQGQVLEKSSTLKVDGDTVFTGNTSCQTEEKIISKESRDSSCPCTLSSTPIAALKQTEKRCSQDDMVVDTSYVAEQSASALSGSSALQTANLLKDQALRSLNDEILSSCDAACKNDEQCVSNQCRTPSRDSQLTSSNSSDVKTWAKKPKQHTASSASLELFCPPSGSLVIDCNVIPESDLQENELNTAQHSLAKTENHEKSKQEGKLKSKCLELFHHIDVQVGESSSSYVSPSRDDLCFPAVGIKKPETKYLQLFPDEGQSASLTPASSNSKANCRTAQKSKASSANYEMGQREQSSWKAPHILGLSPEMEPTSLNGAGVHLLQDRNNVSFTEFIQNPAVHTFPDQSPLMLRHKALLENINTRATSLRGNINTSLDRFEPRPSKWSEEELDSLWIGIRRHGRGSWHAMLLDPKLRFAPWRVARDLATQWDREQSKLFSGKHIPEQSLPQTRDSRENRSTEIRLSLGDVYARRDGSHVTIASSLGNYRAGMGTGLGLNNHLPHLPSETTGTTSRFFEQSLPQISTIPQPGGPQQVHSFSDYVVPVTMAGLVPPPGGVRYGGPSKKEQGTKNMIIIDSDASSEGTISDDHDIRN